MISLQESFNQFVMDRTDQIGNAMLNDSEYIRKQKEIKLLRKAISDYLPPEAKHLFMKYDDADNSLAVIETDYAYRQGLKDGIELKSIMGLVS